MLTYPNGTEYPVIVSWKVALPNPDGSVETFGLGESYIVPPATEARFEVLGQENMSGFIKSDRMEAAPR